MFSDPEPHYEYSNGLYFFWMNGELSKTNAGLIEIAMVYDPDTFTLIKHGSVDGCRRVADEYHGKGFLLNEVIISSKCPLEEINKCLQISGYIKYLNLGSVLDIINV